MLFVQIGQNLGVLFLKMYAHTYFASTPAKQDTITLAKMIDTSISSIEV